MRYGLLGFLLFSLLFLYAPMMVLVGYSFNFSDRVTIWGGFSSRWYFELFSDRNILPAAFLSLQIGLLSAFLAVFAGVMAAFSLDRIRFFRGRLLFSTLLSLPLFLPEVILGLSLLLLFVSLSSFFADLGFVSFSIGGLLPIVIAHSTLSIAYVTVIVRARLAVLDPSIELAALDLGAKPWMVFFKVSLPQIKPSLLAGFLISFILSFDDLLLASFVSTPGYSTLPMVIFSSVRLGLSPEVNALASILLFGSFLLISGVFLFIYRKD